jgi:hypothetical protein
MFKIPVIIAALTAVTFSQSIPQKFFDALIFDKPEIVEFVNKDEITRSERLGIVYSGVRNKSLIGFEIPEEINTGIQSSKYKYEISERAVENSFTEVTFKVPELNFTRKCYFKDGFISNSNYVSRNWKEIESKYFSFRLQEPKYFNDYCIKRLDDFVDMVADTLGFTISEKRILEQKKIGYIFCESEKEVEEITGFKARGMAMLGSDEVVTSFQTHFHEVAHILINYKLKKLGLYTLPFFMEGFAVAVGGRGGMAPRVVTDLGFYLQKTGFLTYDSIITNEQFYSQDANMTYAVSGLYNSFLLSELGGEKYLELYKKVNGDLEYVKGLSLNSVILPDNSKWEQYLAYFDQHPEIYFDAKDTASSSTVYNIGMLPVFKNGVIKFFIVDYFFIGFDELKGKLNMYTSRLFLSMFPKDSDLADNMNEYGIFVDSSSVKVVNFYNDEIVISYIKNLALNSNEIPQRNKRFEFFILENALNKFKVKGFMISDEILETYLDVYKER